MSAPVLPIVVAEFQKNERESFRITLDRFKGTAVIDVRVFYRAGDALRPSRSGLSTSVRHLPAIVDALQEALTRARDAGLLADG